MRRDGVARTCHKFIMAAVLSLQTLVTIHFSYETQNTYLRDQLDRASFDGRNRVEAVNGAVVEYVEGEKEGQQGD